MHASKCDASMSEKIPSVRDDYVDQASTHVCRAVEKWAAVNIHIHRRPSSEKETDMGWAEGPRGRVLASIRIYRHACVRLK